MKPEPPMNANKGKEPTMNAEKARSALEVE
jgi:hypothetical protein